MPNPNKSVFFFPDHGADAKVVISPEKLDDIDRFKHSLDAWQVAQNALHELAGEIEHHDHGVEELSLEHEAPSKPISEGEA